jgi:hypothetical protein
VRSLVVVVLVTACGHGESISPAACNPAVVNAVCCTQDSECTSESFPEFCLAPGELRGCGICNSDPSTCSVDADCKAQDPTTICQVRVCACDGDRECVQGCTSDAGCAEGESCDLATNRCGRTLCGVDADCPADFVCGDAGCLRRECESSSDCDAFCVDGHCYQNAGECVGVPV